MERGRPYGGERVLIEVKRWAAAALPVVERYEGAAGRAWFAALHRHVLHPARATAGPDCRRTARFRLPRRSLVAQAMEAARNGAFAAIGGETERDAQPMAEALSIPAYVMQEAALPPTAEALRASLAGSSLDRDGRRIRKAAMTYRIAGDRETLRSFYDLMYRPHIQARHGAAAHLEDFRRMENALASGGELLCIDDGRGAWIAGNYNIRHKDKMVMAWTGTAPGAPGGASAAAYLFSMERAIALGYERIGLGRSLPFLGPGVARYKANWGGVIRRDANPQAVAAAFIDLARPEMRSLLARHPLIIHAGQTLAAVQWVESEAFDWSALAADIERFAGLGPWFVVGPRGPLRDAASAHPRIRPVVVDASVAAPLWLGEALRGALHDASAV